MSSESVVNLKRAWLVGVLTLQSTHMLEHTMGIRLLVQEIWLQQQKLWYYW